MIGPAIIVKLNAGKLRAQAFLANQKLRRFAFTRMLTCQMTVGSIATPCHTCVFEVGDGMLVAAAPVPVLSSAIDGAARHAKPQAFGFVALLALGKVYAEAHHSTKV